MKQSVLISFVLSIFLLTMTASSQAQMFMEKRWRIGIKIRNKLIF